MNKKQQLLLAAHKFAAGSIDIKLEEMEAATLTAFKDAGFTARVDLGFFRAHADDYRLQLRGMAKDKLPSELAAETV